MAFAFTAAQQKVIDLHGKNILVSAAAGSGKTAVLVERIVKLVADGSSPADIDRLLVVTFTNMAAGEMRERISQALTKRLEQEPENEHLQRQLTLIHNAQITTIDSFCLFILRNHFHRIGLDPGFRIGDEGELKLLARDVMGEMLEAWYTEGSSEFLECVDYFTTGSRDNLLEEYIEKLYHFAMSFPWPEEWLTERKSDYAPQTEAEAAHSNWGRFLCRLLGAAVAGCLDELERCLSICGQPDGPYMYQETLEAEIRMFADLEKAAGLADYYSAWGRVVFGRLPAKKDDMVSAAKRERVQSIRNQVKNQVKELGEHFFTLSPEQSAERMALIHQAAGSLMDLTLDYKRRLDAAKRDKNIIDFSDLEHFALEILLEKGTDGTYAPTAAARELQEHFVEILTDEYQDSNLVQELLLQSVSGEDGNRFNRFMVGDVKQSIYRFRLARPEIFMEKYARYPLLDASDYMKEHPAEHASEHLAEHMADHHCRIDLRQNFRSRIEVINSVNHIFEKIMQKPLGGVEYDEQAALYPGAAYPEPEQEETADNKTELLLLERSSEETEEPPSGSLSQDTPREMEARMIARRIKELVGKAPVTAKETGALRPARFRDMVILLRTNAGWDEVFRKVLEEEGIPVHIASKTGYFETTEIRTILQLLRVLDNPLQDIPLYGVMRSFFGGFSDEEIAGLMAEEQGTAPLFHKLEGQEGNQNGGKIRVFLDFIAKYREKSIYIPIQDLLQELVMSSGFYHYTAARPAGEQRVANLEMLLVKAAAYAKTSYYGLFHFIRYIEQLEKYDVDYGEANILDEQADVVRLMSIHKSKGLEFPICFVAGLAKKFQMQDSYSGVITDVDLGIGIDYVDSTRRVIGRSLLKSVLSYKLKLDNLGEELRILYVAMTRAREKLILSGVVKSTAAIQGRDGRLSFLQMAAAGNYLDFLLPVIMGEREVLESTDYFTVRLFTPGQLFSAAVTEQAGRMVRRRELGLAALTGNGLLSAPGMKQLTGLTDKFNRTYPRIDLTNLYTKTTVSELKKGGQERYTAQEERNKDAFVRHLFEEPEIIPYIPRFRKGDEDVSGTVRGSAYHRVMELISFRAASDALEESAFGLPSAVPADETPESGIYSPPSPPELSAASFRTDGISANSEVSKWDILEEEINRQMEQAYASGRLSGEYREAVRPDRVMDFMKTPLAARMMAADREGKLYKEQPFVIGLDADRLGSEFSAAETVLIQGIIDVYFEENNQLAVMDYKTDAVRGPEELAARYQKQLDYYAEALEQLTGKKVKEKIIFSFHLNKEIRI